MPSNTEFTHSPTNRSMPEATVIPVLQYADASEAATWLCQAFGFSQRLRIGGHRIQMAVGTGALVVASRAGAAQPEDTGQSVLIRVSNVDQHFLRVRDTGAKILAEPASFPYGERQYSVVDPGGHVWTFSQTEASIEPSAWGGELLASGTNAA